MISFILNDKPITTHCKPGMSLLDFIRYEANLPGTKIGCREGDCGACTVLIGELKENRVDYHSVTSCLFPLINAHGKHVVTIEGINLSNGLNPAQRVMAEHAASQCGFCTPGFVMSFSAFCLNHEPATRQRAIEAIAGNICRCTGYKSIERAATDLAQLMTNKDIANPVGWMVQKGYLPEYFIGIPEQLGRIKPISPEMPEANLVLAGGTDLMVQQPDSIYEKDVITTQSGLLPKGITLNSCSCTIGGATTVKEIVDSRDLQGKFPVFREYLMLVSSEPIRNMATVAGNIVNASPIGDLSIMLLTLNAQVSTIAHGKTRHIPLHEFFTGYKQLNLNPGELIQYISFELPKPNATFSFEKVSKRKYLDIASVNSAMLIEIESDTVKQCRLSAGGVAPIPKYLHKTSSFLIGKKIDASLVNEALELIQSEISPISDIRGSETYKRLLVKQLFLAHMQKALGESFDKLFR